MQQKRRLPTKRRRDLATALNSATIHFLRRLAQEDDSRDAGPAGLSALSVLVFAGPQRLGRLAMQERVKTSTMTRIVDVLERSGLVARAGDPSDRRQVWVHPTAAGRRVLLEARERRIAYVADRLSSFGPDDVAVLERAAQLLERLAADADGP